ncbi:MAG: flagellar protein FlgN [Lachnospiraceae bacterium]|nr:flagellar protein FlgN [Lachnospiraceae bacterium]
MASLIENLITQLNEEYAIYEQLLQVSMEKTSAIVSNNLDRLKDTTDKEQLLVDTLTGLGNTRQDTMKNIANVLNKRGTELKVIDVVNFLEGQPEFRDPLMSINEKLAKLARKLKEVNTHNQNLIQESLAMIEYNINLLQNLNRAPETAEYTKDMFKGAGNYAGNTVPTMGKFDTKQ